VGLLAVHVAPYLGHLRACREQRCALVRSSTDGSTTDLQYDDLMFDHSICIAR
jgi:hypothetical protein